MSFIQELIRGGDVAAYVDGRFGHWNDLSNNSNNGVMSTGCKWFGHALGFPANTDEVTIADDVTMRLTTGSIVAVGDFQSMVSDEYVVAHIVAGPSGYRFWIDDVTRLRFQGNNVTQDLTVSIFGAKSIGVTFANGGTPIGYVDGLSAGNFGGVVNVNSVVGTTEIGNWNNFGRLRSLFKAVLICNRILDAAEMAKAHEELVDMAYPTSTWSFAKCPQDVFKREPKLISGWNLLPTGGQVADEVTTRDLTTINQMVHKPGILGQGMSGPIAGYLATANDPYLAADFATNGLSIECWCRYRSLTAASEYIFNVSGRISLYMTNVTPGQVYFAVFDSDAITQLASTALNFVQPEQIFHVIATAEANGAVRIYVNGVLGATVDTMANFNLGAWGRPAVWGAFWNFTNGIDADIYKPRIYDHELSQEEVSKKYLEGAQAIQFKTDWGFQVSPAAEGGVIHQQIGTRSSPFRAGDAVGRFKIETDTVDGQLCKVLTCTTAGIVYIKTSDFFDCTWTEAIFGTIDFWVSKTGASDFFLILGDAIEAYDDVNQDGYALRLNTVERVMLIKLVGGAGNPNLFYTDASEVAVDTWTRFRITRSSAGVFTVYQNNVIVGNIAVGTNPVTDITNTVADYILFDMTAGDKICLGDVRANNALTKYLGVVAP